MESEPDAVAVLREAIDAFGGTIEAFAASTLLPRRHNERTYRRWLAGEGTIPAEALPVLRRLANKRRP